MLLGDVFIKVMKQHPPAICNLRHVCPASGLSTSLLTNHEAGPLQSMPGLNVPQGPSQPLLEPRADLMKATKKMKKRVWKPPGKR